MQALAWPFEIPFFPFSFPCGEFLTCFVVFENWNFMAWAMYRQVATLVWNCSLYIFTLFSELYWSWASIFFFHFHSYLQCSVSRPLLQKSELFIEYLLEFMTWMSEALFSFCWLKYLELEDTKYVNCSAVAAENLADFLFAYLHLQLSFQFFTLSFVIMNIFLGGRSISFTTMGRSIL